MENVDWKEDPAVEEIRRIRESIHVELKGMTNEERVAWYNEQAEIAMAEFRKTQKSQ